MSRINFAQFINETETLDSLPVMKNLHIVNIVGTVELLEKGQGISLEALALELPQLIKFEPRRFAAAVMRLQDSISTTTCLIFRSGKLVVVGPKTHHHSIYAAHMYRKRIESVMEVFRIDGDRLGLFNLMGRTEFKNWGIWNIVAHDKIPNRPNLKELSIIAPDLAAWDPEFFPGLKLLVWLRPKNQCNCKIQKKNRACECNCRALIFDSGKIVITGCKTVQDVYKSRERIHYLFADEELQDKEGRVLPKHVRFAARRQKLLEQVEFAGWVKEPSAAPPPGAEALGSLFDQLLFGVKLPKRQAISSSPSSSFPPFITACQLGQVENAKFILSHDPSVLKEAWNNEDIRDFVERLVSPT